jgi:hypothetical protein
VQVPQHLQSSSSIFSCSINLGFLTEGKLAATLIIPSSWGSQRAGHHHAQGLTAPRQQPLFWRHHRVAAYFLAPLPGKREDFCEGSSSHTHSLLCYLFCFTLFILPALLFISKTQKNLESLVVVISLLLVYYV